MPAATYDSEYLLKMFNRKAGRPAADAAFTDAVKYERLSEAQNNVIVEIANVAPKALYPKVAYASMPQLTTTDNQIFTFGTDSNSYARFPMGQSGIYTSINNIPNDPWREGQDYIDEGNQIRIPNNGTYTGTLYWYGISQPADITAIVQPALIPEASRELIVIEAVRQFSQEWLRNAALVDEMNNEWERRWPVWCQMWKTHFRAGGALNVFSGINLAAISRSNQWST